MAGAEPSKRCGRRRWLPLATGAATATVCVYRRWLQPWHSTWGASPEEAAAPLAGDELIAEPATQATRAVTIAAPPEEVWRWVVQLGADRGGFYSYDWLENLFGLGIHSAAEPVPQWQQRSPGDLVYADSAGRGGWYVMDVRPREALVLQMANVEAGRPARRSDPGKWEYSWSFVLVPAAAGTRLLVRERVGFRNELVRLAMSPFALVSFVMTRKMMLGIRARAEHHAGRGAE